MGISSSSDVPNHVRARNEEEAKDEKLRLLDRMREDRRTKAEVCDANVTCFRGRKKAFQRWNGRFFSACEPQELSLVAQ